MDTTESLDLLPLTAEDEDAVLVLDECISPKHMMHQTIVEIDAMLEGIRARRNSYMEHLKKRSKIDGTMREQEYKLKFDALAETIKKKIAKVDASLDALQTTVNKLRVLELEYD